MKVKFHDVKYDLTSRPNIFSTRFQCMIEKGDHSYNDIISDTANVENIVVYDDEDEVEGVYSGYSTRVAFTIMDNISIEFENTDIIGQVNSLASSVTTQAAQIAELEDTNETQDGAIEDLAEVVNSIIE